LVDFSRPPGNLDAPSATCPSEYYFRTTPRFGTGATKCDRLNRLICIAGGERRADAVIITVYEVT
jgi:hypothetical protein